MDLARVRSAINSFIRLVEADKIENITSYIGSAGRLEWLKRSNGNKTWYIVKNVDKREKEKNEFITINLDGKVRTFLPHGSDDSSIITQKTTVSDQREPLQRLVSVSLADSPANIASSSCQ